MGESRGARGAPKAKGKHGTAWNKHTHTTRPSRLGTIRECGASHPERPRRLLRVGFFARSKDLERWKKDTSKGSQRRGAGTAVKLHKAQNANAFPARQALNGYTASAFSAAMLVATKE